jgi:hypothetical protein
MNEPNGVGSAGDSPAVDVEEWSTRESIDEASSLTRRRHYGLRTVLRTAYRTYLLVPGAIIGWFGIRGVVGYVISAGRGLTPLIGIVTACCAAVPCVLAGLLIRGVRQERRAAQAMCGAVRFTLTDKGVNRTGPGSRSLLDPWSIYSGFHVGRHVILLPVHGSSAYLRIPIGAASQGRLQEIRAVLSAHLPELTKAELLGKLGR